MKHAKLEFNHGFHVSIANARAQGAVMVIVPGEAEGGPGNRHRGADQWLMVVDGSGTATVAGRDLPLETGTLLLIEAGETHEIRNTGHGPLKTINVYVPPAYDSDGEELPAGKA